MNLEKKLEVGILAIVLFGITTVGIVDHYKKENKIMQASETVSIEIEITNEFINIRKEPNTVSDKVGQVKKGETYKVNAIYEENETYKWYKIENGWIASDREQPYVKNIMK